jgi:hypothetical protein
MIKAFSEKDAGLRRIGIWRYYQSLNKRKLSEFASAD